MESNHSAQVSGHLLESIRTNLDELKSLILSIGQEQYNNTVDLMDGSTIGQHVRHMLEFYLCLLSGISSGSVNYDLRKRDHLIESDSRYALYTIEKISCNIQIPEFTKKLLFVANYRTDNGNQILAETTYGRELANCLEHAIHHQAIIKISLNALGLSQIAGENFGVAPATIRSKSCVQ